MFWEKMSFMFKIALSTMKIFITLTYVWHCVIIVTILGVYLSNVPLQWIVSQMDEMKSLIQVGNIIWVFQHSRWEKITFTIGSNPNGISSNKSLSLLQFIVVCCICEKKIVLDNHMLCTSTKSKLYLCSKCSMKSFWCEEVITTFLSFL
jgi:hypothetical protein